jgi:hypothetical protein
MQQQHSVRSSVAGLMARQPTSAEAALILPSAPLGLQAAFAMLPARKRPRR